MSLFPRFYTVLCFFLLLFLIDQTQGWSSTLPITVVAFGKPPSWLVPQRRSNSNNNNNNKSKKRQHTLTSSSSSSSATSLAATVVDMDTNNDGLLAAAQQQAKEETSVVGGSIDIIANNNSNNSNNEKDDTQKRTTTRILVDDTEFIRPDRDLRQYRLIQLANGLQVMLVSSDAVMSAKKNAAAAATARSSTTDGDTNDDIIIDNDDDDDDGNDDAPTTNSIGVEAAAVHVQAGHYDDTIPGLAHFHEHMLFLGTSKYTKEEEYEQFLRQYGGFANAWTDMEDTSYFFSVTTEKNDDSDNSDSDDDDNITGDNNTNDNSNKASPALHGALDRLAQFFISPLFNQDSVDREIKAIDSEYRNGKTSDGWRNYQFLKSTSHPDHPFAKFGCGNQETLSSRGMETLLQELRNFWKNHYQTYNLRLSVAGHASLDALQSTVEDTFGQLPHSDCSRPVGRRVRNNPNQFFPREHAVYGKHRAAFGPNQLSVLHRVRPLTETRLVKIHFAVPPLHDPVLVRGGKPYRTISHLLGHESPGSLHALLNAMGYTTGLASGVAIDSSDFCLFGITVSLTPNGMKNYQHVLDLIFQWIALIKRHALEDNKFLNAYHEELRQIAQVNFKFREVDDPADFVSSVADLMFDYGLNDDDDTDLNSQLLDPRRILLGSSETEDLDPAVTREFLDRLRPENAMIVITSSDFNDNDNGGEWTTEPRYGAQSQVEPLTEDQKRKWEFPSEIDERLHLPALNAYIPSDFSLRCDDNDDDTGSTVDSAPSSLATSSMTVSHKETMAPPVLLIDEPSLRLWHKMDRYWRVPKAFIKLAILSPDVYRSPRTMTYSRIFQRVLNDDLNSFVYDAIMAGCSYRVTCTPSGFRVSVGGYSEKLAFLLDTLTCRILSLIEEMKDGSVGNASEIRDESSLQSKFDKATESLLRETKNFRLDPPNEVCNYNSRLLMEETVWYLDNYVDEMEGDVAKRHPLTMLECAKVVEECFMGRIQCEALCMGNIDRAGAQDVAKLIQKHFIESSRPLSEVEIPSFRSLKLPTRDEARAIFGPEAAARSVPTIYADLAASESEENNAVELVLQAGSELELGYEGMAILDLISHISYTSAYNQLRTIEQLGYLVSAFARKTAGNAWSMSVVVQSSTHLPDVLEERCENWLLVFREELGSMSAESLAAEASAVVAQLLEDETKLSQEIGRHWGEILNTESLTDSLRTPAFDRLERLAAVLEEGKDESGVVRGEAAQRLKDKVLSFFDRHFAVTSPSRRAMSAMVYSQRFKSDFESIKSKPGVVSSFADIRHTKQFLASWPTIPYWRIDLSTTTKEGMNEM